MSVVELLDRLPECERWEVTAVELARMVEQIPGRYPGRVFCGAEHIYLPDEKCRIVSGDSAYAPFTAPELARAWLGSILERAHRTRIMTGGSIMAPATCGPALFFDPPKDRGGEWVMLDVKAAYWTLYSRLTLDCLFGLDGRGGFDYRPGTLVVPAEDKVWVEPEKPLRNAAWGVMLGGRISWYDAGQLRSKPSRSRFEARGLTQTVLAQMNAAAHECRGLGAVMWLTDAAICRPDAADKIVAHLSERWRLNAVVKAAGADYLYGLGDYLIGNAETAGEHNRRAGHDSLTPLAPASRDRLAEI